MSAVDVLVHNVTEGDKGYIQEIVGPHLVPFMYLGAKHMVTGYDHAAWFRMKHQCCVQPADPRYCESCLETENPATPLVE